MQDDRVQKLRVIAQSDPDPARRRKATELLRQRGEEAGQPSVTMSPERRAQLQSKIAETRAKTEQLRAESGDPGMVNQLGRAIVGTLADPNTPRTLMRDVSVGLDEAANAATFGGWRQVTQPLNDAVGLGEEYRQTIQETPEMIRNIGRATPALGAGHAIMRALPATASAIKSGLAYGAAQYPAAISRRMSEGDDLSTAEQGARDEAVATAITGGALRGLGRATEGTSRMVEGLSGLPATRNSITGTVLTEAGKAVVTPVANIGGEIARAAAPLAGTITSFATMDPPTDLSSLPPAERLRAAAQISRQRDQEAAARLLPKMERERKRLRKQRMRTYDPISGDLID